MTRTTLRIAALLLAGAVALGATGVLGVSPWWGLPLVPAVWFLATTGGRAAHGFLLRRTLERDRRTGRRSAASVAVDAAVRLRRIAGGDPGFTADGDRLADLERAVFFPGNPGDEAAVMQDIVHASRPSRAAIVAGLRVLHDEAVESLANPLHALHFDADTILPLLGHPLPRLFRRWRAGRAWLRVRSLFDPAWAEECLAVRLLQSRMPRAALHVLADAPKTPRRRALRRLSRLLFVIRQNEAGDLGFRMTSLGTWAPAVVLVMGRRLRDLIPGDPLMEAPAKGAATLEAAVRHVPRLARQIEALARDVPTLAPSCTLALSRILDRPEDDVRREMAAGRLRVRRDRVLSIHLRGLALLSERRPQEAAFEFETAVALAPDLTPAAFSLAVARRRAGDPVRGAQALRDHAIRNPRNPDVPVYLARYLADAGDRAAARGAYLKGLEVFPDSVQIRLAYAKDLASWGEDSAAAEQFDVARRAQPGDAWLALLTGRARLHAGRPREAVEPLEQASRTLRGGERAEARFWLLNAFRDQGLHDLAKPIADELVEGLGRGQEMLLDKVAEYLEERHDFGRARRANSRARRLRGDRW